MENQEIEKELELKEEDVVSQVEKEIFEKEQEELKKQEEKRLKYNAYHRDYYKNNKEKFNKHTDPNRYRGDRGKNKKMRWKLSIMNLDKNKPIMSQEFPSFEKIGETLQLPAQTVSMIHRGKYKLGMGKHRTTKEYARYKIEKI